MKRGMCWNASLTAALTTVFLAVAGEAAEPAAPAVWPLWDGKESVADYAKRAGIKDVEMNLDLGGGVSMKMTLIPAGKFLMGINPEKIAMIEGIRVLVKEADEGWYGASGPQREVTLTKPFYMGIHEVTQEQYEQVMGTNPSTFKGKTNPVETLAWPQAALFCKKLSAATGMNIALPTDAQWEFAFRAGTKTKFYWGDDPADTYTFENYGDKSMTTGGLKGKIEGAYERRDKNHDDGFPNVAPVGSFKPNPWGLYDMNGNAVEWVHDFPCHNLFGAPTVDPKGPGYGFLLTAGHYGRGSDWAHAPNPFHWRPNRGWVDGVFLSGFRVVAHMKSAAVPARDAKKIPPKAPPAAVAGPADPKLRVPPGCSAAPIAQAEPYTKTGWAQAIVHEATGMELAYIPAGSFLMGIPPWADVEGQIGADETDRWISIMVHRQMRQHRVTLTEGFYMGKTEVTQAQWEKVMGNNPSFFSGNAVPEDFMLTKYQSLVAQRDAGPDAPVEMVSWDDCQAFCEKAGGGLRLPTEAQWEYACRAGTKGVRAGDDVDDLAWCAQNSDESTHPVGMKKPNAWGLYDMHGNVWEWCQDWFDAYDKVDARTDPTGPTTATGNRVIRGGGWGDYGSRCFSGVRGSYVARGKPAPAFHALGFRLVIPAVTP